MTPKEKAEDIYNKMKGFRVKNSHRKKCALICVDELLNLEELIEWDYWVEVKLYIEKL